jgi:hypothetical protein
MEELWTFGGRIYFHAQEPLVRQVLEGDFFRVREQRRRSL